MEKEIRLFTDTKKQVWLLFENTAMVTRNLDRRALILAFTVKRCKIPQKEHNVDRALAVDHGIMREPRNGGPITSTRKARQLKILMR